MGERGEIIVYRGKKELIFGVIVEKKEKSHLIISEFNEKKNIDHHKIEFFLKKKVKISGKSHEMAKEVGNYRAVLEEDMEGIEEGIDLGDLYEYVKEEGIEGYEGKDLADLYFSGVDEERELRMAIELSRDGLYFKYKSGRYYPKKEKEVAERKNRIEQERKNQKKREEKRELVRGWFEENLMGEGLSKEGLGEGLPKKGLGEGLPKKGLGEGLPKEVMEYFEPLRGYLIHQEEWGKKEVTFERIEELRNNYKVEGLEHAEGLYNFLLRWGVLREEEDLILLKYELKSDFSEKMVGFVGLVGGYEGGLEGREDFRDIYTMSIDTEGTRDIDDGLTLEEKGGGYEVGVHIADVSHFIKRSNELDEEALMRSSSIYFPFRRWGMFPGDLSEFRMSLIAGELRPVLSFIFRINGDYEVIDHELKLCEIRVDKNLSYQEAECVLESGGEEGRKLQILYGLAKRLKERREAEGALEFNRTELKIKRGGDGRLRIMREDQDLKTQFLVKELMIYINHKAANICHEEGIPGIYIYQDEPEGEKRKYSEEELEGSRWKFFEQMKGLKRSEMSMLGGRHYSLGLSRYTQCSSPIRRYHDLLVQRQLKRYIMGVSMEDSYSEEEIKSIFPGLERTQRTIKQAEREKCRYWILKYIEQEKGRIWEGQVIKKVSKGYMIEIQEVSIPVFLYSEKTMGMDEKVEVIVEKVKPLSNTITIKRARRTFENGFG